MHYPHQIRDFLDVLNSSTDFCFADSPAREMEQRKTKSSRESAGRQTSLEESFGSRFASSKEVQTPGLSKNLSSGRVYPCSMADQILRGYYCTCGRLEPDFRQVVQ